jgi:hypothetical protein
MALERNTTRTYHRLSFQTYSNAEGPEGWRIVDRLTKQVIMRGPGSTIKVMEAFLSNERMEALLCAEIDREFPAQVIDSQAVE